MSDSDSESVGTINGNSEYWDYDLECLERTQDLQLAAELGKTLLERNKELETLVKQHQTVIDDQTQEIEYLTKQTAALREVNDSRLRIYEQLEVSIQDLERANHRLVLENSAEKKHIKSLNTTIESLEGKCEDLQAVIDELRLQVDGLKRKSQSQKQEVAAVVAKPAVVLVREVDHQKQPTPKTDKLGPGSVVSPASDKDEVDGVSSGMEQLSELLGQLREVRSQCSREERRVVELEEQLATMVQQNQALENQVVQLHHRNDDVKSMHDELTALEDVRQGQICGRCLRNVTSTDSLELPEDDDSSMLEELMNTSQHRSSFSMDVQILPNQQSSPLVKPTSTNPYKDLVEKYEALVEVHRNQQICKDTDEESGHGDSLPTTTTSSTSTSHKKTVSRTPTDFSEAETSSSGFSDETSNKSTQTEGKVGSFLCTIGDGDDCTFSIYDEANPVDCRFRTRPEYQKLFKEIFSVLKRAAETKEENDKLPVLDDFTAKEAPKVPPVTPSNDLLPEFLDDDSQSVVSSTMSELSTQNEPTTVIENIIQAQNQPIPEASGKKNERILKPLIKQQFDYLTEGNGRNRSSSRRRKNKNLDRSDSPVTHIIGSPKINYSSRPNSGRKKREMRNVSIENIDQTWNGNSLQFTRSMQRNLASPTPSQGSGKGVIEFKPSSASQDLNKLRKLEQSYADVLRNADSGKIRHRRK